MQSALIQFHADKIQQHMTTLHVFNEAGKMHKKLSRRRDEYCTVIYCILGLIETLDAMLQSKKAWSELTTQIKNNPDLHQRLMKAVSNQDCSKIHAESREDHPEWFEGSCPMNVFAITFI